MHHRNSLILAFLLFSFPMIGLTQSPERISEVNTFLDKWHEAAANADSISYFGAIADDGFYIGTDKSEVWTKQAFQVWASPYFKSGKTWKFKGENRHIYFSVGGHFAWFDEMAVSPTSEFRGSGVLVQTESGWQIRQYVLSVMVPNEIYKEIDGLIKNFEVEKLK